MLTYFERFLAGQLHVLRPGADLARVLLVVMPLISAALIAISRCEDYRHDVYDVTVGSILGITIAHFTYRRYYPGLKAHNCETPYPSRMESLSANGHTKLRDEEERIQSAAQYSVDDLQDGSEALPLRESSRDTSWRRTSGT